MEAKQKLERYTCEFLQQLVHETFTFRLQASRSLAIFWRVADIVQMSLHANKAISKRDDMDIYNGLESNFTVVQFTILKIN